MNESGIDCRQAIEENKQLKGAVNVLSILNSQVLAAVKQPISLIYPYCIGLVILIKN